MKLEHEAQQKKELELEAEQLAKQKESERAAEMLKKKQPKEVDSTVEPEAPKPKSMHHKDPKSKKSRQMLKKKTA